MMITIHGFPAKTKYQDVKMLIKQECNINDFILDNLINDSDGTKKVRIGLTDNTEGYKVMKCLDGYRMPGNFVLKAIPVGKAAENAVTIISSGGLPPLRTYHQAGHVKARPLLKDEVRVLLSLIAKHRIITDKSTNATSNKMKVDAWKSIANAFSVATGEFRRAAQLRLKWENLKKSARKRNDIIKQNNSKTGGRRRYIPPDETLDRVAILLSASRNDVKVELDDDSDSGMPLSRFRDVQIPQPHNETLTSSNNPETSNDATLASSFVPETSNSRTLASSYVPETSNSSTLASSYVPETSNSRTLTPSYVPETSNSRTLASSYVPETTNELTAPSSIRESSNSHVEESFTEQEESNQQIMPMEFFVINDNVESLEENNTQESSPIKEQTLAEQEQKSRILKNQALAAYFQAKAEKVRLENKKLQLEIELLKNNRTANVFNS